MSYKIESEFTHAGLECKVLFLDMGHRCGYVNVGSTSLGGKDYSENLPISIDPGKLELGKRSLVTALCWDGERRSLNILCNVHGGVTFSGTLGDSNSWWIGFDCAHYQDAKDMASLEEYFPDKVENVRKYSFFDEESIVRTKDYVESECKSLAEQLQEIISLLK